MRLSLVDISAGRTVLLLLLMLMLLMSRVMLLQLNGSGDEVRVECRLPVSVGGRASTGCR